MIDNFIAMLQKYARNGNNFCLKSLFIKYENLLIGEVYPKLLF